MKADKLYMLIGNWRKEMEEASKMGCVAEMGQVMLELREDMYTSTQKSAGKSGKAMSVSDLMSLFRLKKQIQANVRRLI